MKMLRIKRGKTNISADTDFYPGFVRIKVSFPRPKGERYRETEGICLTPAELARIAAHFATEAK